MKTPIVYTYSESNRSSSLIAEALGCDRIYSSSDFRVRNNHLVINWGCGYVPRWWRPCHILNSVRAVNRSINKLSSFAAFQEYGVPCPKWTIDVDIAESWLRTQQSTILCRTSTDGHDGSGIVIAKRTAELAQAPLYTLFTPVTNEYRVHVVGDGVIFFTERKRREGSPKEIEIRTGNDFYFAWTDDIPDVVGEAAIAATRSIGLDFSGVDVGYDAHTNKAIVFENNTAPGSFGRVTLQRYVEAFQQILME